MNNVIALDIIREEKQKYETETEAIQLDQIMKKLFMLTNHVPIIDFLNSVHKDNLSYATKLTYLDKEIIKKDEESKKNKFLKFYSDMYIRVEDENRIFEYIIEFQTDYDNQIGIRLFRYSFELAVKQVETKDLRDEMVIKLAKPYLIMLEENKRIPDIIKLKLEIHTGDRITFPCEVLKYWQYDLDRLARENMYLLYPLKVISIRKKTEKAKELNKRLKKKNELLTRDNPLIKEIEDDIVKVTSDIYNHTKDLFMQGKVTISEFNEFGVIIENICEYLNSQVENILQGAVEEVKKVVKTFIDKELMDKVIAAEAAAKVAVEKAEAEAEAKAEAKREAKREIEEIKREAEETIKNSVLALITVMGAESIAKTLNISIEKIEDIISKK